MQKLMLIQFFFFDYPSTMKKKMPKKNITFSVHCMSDIGHVQWISTRENVQSVVSTMNYASNEGVVALCLWKYPLPPTMTMQEVHALAGLKPHEVLKLTVTNGPRLSEQDSVDLDREREPAIALKSEKPETKEVR